MNRAKLLQGLTLFEEAIATLKQGIEDELPMVEPAKNKTQLSKATGFCTRTIAQLMKSGAVPTYDQGKKAKASDIQKAMQDRPARMVGQSRTRQQQPFRRINVY